MQFWEGGIRVPTIFHWPDHIKPKTTSHELTSMMDIFPTLMNIVGGSVPDDRIIDGQDISSTLFNCLPEPQPEPGTLTHSEPRLLVFYCQDILFAVRFGSYKFHFYTQKAWTKEGYHAEPGRCGDGGYPFQTNFQCGACTFRSYNPPDCISDYDPPLMFNVDKDPNEAYPLNTTLPEHQAVLDAMMVKLDEFLDTMVFGPPLLDNRSEDVIPCCTPETWPICECNYSYKGPLPKPGNPNPSFKFEKIRTNDEFDLI
ncbi:arylsulfatase-like [Amphiura filiformis]|uniref:arylsulfatase-like n=1 Tax=Amphiura filiformis TaxID=82378 RepID=UPI003B2172F4